LEKPLLLEGEAGVGKTEAAKAAATALGAPLIRLQCYEGLDVAHAVYEWNYARQLLHIRAAQEGTVDESELFGREFLIRRPVLEALESEERAVLLIDEIDRADEAARFAAELRSLDLQKPPGLAETIDWVRALTALGQQELDVENVEATLGSLLKYHEDVLAIRDDALAGLVASSRG